VQKNLDQSRDSVNAAGRLSFVTLPGSSSF
jgi:hypothetical protein